MVFGPVYLTLSMDGPSQISGTHPDSGNAVVNYGQTFQTVVRLSSRRLSPAARKARLITKPGSFWPSGVPFGAPLFPSHPSPSNFRVRSIPASPHTLPPLSIPWGSAPAPPTLGRERGTTPIRTSQNLLVFRQTNPLLRGRPMKNISPHWLRVNGLLALGFRRYGRG